MAGHARISWTMKCDTSIACYKICTLVEESAPSTPQASSTTSSFLSFGSAFLSFFSWLISAALFCL